MTADKRKDDHTDEGKKESIPFDEALRRMINTPPKPRKNDDDKKPKRSGKNARLEKG